MKELKKMRYVKPCIELAMVELHHQLMEVSPPVQPGGGGGGTISVEPLIDDETDTNPFDAKRYDMQSEEEWEE